MKLIIIHGPPAAGKLTIANAIAELTAFKVFHNHLTIDCAKPVFDFGTPAFWRIVLELRLHVIAEAARENIDIIHTFCYAKGDDDKQFQQLIDAAEDNGGEVHIVLLRCGDEERKRRIGNPSRHQIGKLTDPDSVGRDTDVIDLQSPYPGRDTLIVDTDHITPDETAEVILQHYNLL
ncbi:MAG: AAA family ATPase [Pyrinomonadaceae bacterium]